MEKTFTPCEDCPYSYSKNGQDMGMCEICELTYFANETKKLTRELEINKQEWISVEDRLPDIYDLVLVCWDGDIVESDFISPSGRWFHYNHRKITHWKPLPQPPQAKGAE